MYIWYKFLALSDQSRPDWSNRLFFVRFISQELHTITVRKPKYPHSYKFKLIKFWKHSINRTEHKFCSIKKNVKHFFIQTNFQELYDVPIFEKKKSNKRSWIEIKCCNILIYDLPTAARESWYLHGTPNVNKIPFTSYSRAISLRKLAKL